MLSIVLSSEKVAAVIADRLAACAPEGMGVHSATNEVLVTVGAHQWVGSAVPAILDDPEGWQAGEENLLLESIVCSALGGVADTISEAGAALWPADPRNPQALPQPGARVVDGMLEWWFGDRDSPVLVLEPVAIDSLT